MKWCIDGPLLPCTVLFEFELNMFAHFGLNLTLVGGVHCEVHFAAHLLSSGTRPAVRRGRETRPEIWNKTNPVCLNPTTIFSGKFRSYYLCCNAGYTYWK